MASATAPPTTAKTTTSVDPLYTQAVAQAQAALAAQQAPVQSEQQASDTYYAQRQQDATDNAAAVSDLLKGIGPNISSAYTSAAQNDSLLANGFSAGMQDALKGNAENLNGILSKLGLPANIDSKAASTGDVLKGLGGYIPGKALDRSGAAFTAAADLLPATALLKGQDTSKQLAIEGGKAHTALDSKLAEMAGNLPGDIQANYSKLQSLALENKKFAETVSNDKFNQAYKIAQQKLASAKYKTSIDEFNAKQALAVTKYKTSVTEFNANYQIKVANQKIAAARLSIDATKAANSQYNADRNYQLALGRLGVSRAALALKITQNAFKAANGGYTQAQLTKLTEQANSMANTALHGTMKTSVVYDSNGQPIAKRSTSTLSGAGVSYNQALGEMMKKGIPVQVALAALDRVYPSSSQPSPEALQKLLGPLTPDAIGALVNAGSQAAAAGNKMNYIPGDAGGFVPRGTTVQMGRADQGRDIQITPGSPIVAPGSGVVVRVGSDPGGGGAHFGPQYPIVHFTSGPYAGQTIYIGHTVTSLKQGQKFNIGDVLSTTQQSGPLNGGAPSGWAEIGFAPGGSPGRFGQQPPF